MDRACIVVVSLILASISLANEPPQVSVAVPEIGSRDVDPGLTEISVTFDRDMSQGGFSFVGGGPAFPATTGPPRWKDERTCILPVQLEPGKEYRLGLNSVSFKNFQSVEGVPLEPVVFTFRTSGKGMDTASKLSAGIQEDSRRQLQQLLQTSYSYRDVRKVDWQERWKIYASKLDAATTSREFSEITGELLAASGDPHIWLKEGGEIIPAFIRRVDPNADYRWLEKTIPGFQREGKTTAKGTIGDDIGYIGIFTWSKLDDSAYEPLYRALQEFSDRPGLILDLRFNSGGSEPIAREFAGCFVREKSMYATHVSVLPGKDSVTFGPQSERWIEPTPERPAYRGKVAVITGPAIMSSAEAFLLMMKQAPDTVLFGLPSYGSSGNPKPYTLPNGVTVYLPSWKAMRPDGTPFETEGIAPDIRVDATLKDGDFEAEDPVLKAAVKWLRE